MNEYYFQLKQIVKLAIPIVIAETGAQLSHTINMIMIGNQKAIYIAACSLASYLFLVPLLFGIGTTIIITSFVGAANGSEDIAECKSLFSNAFFIQLANGLFLTLFTLLFGLLIPYLDSDVEKVTLSCSYYNIVALSSLPIVLLYGLKGYIDGFGFTAFGMVAILLGNALNVFFN